MKGSMARAFGGKKANKDDLSYNRDNWGTPDELFRALNKRFHFTIDLAATRQNRKCKRYFGPKSTLGADALKRSWKAEVGFLNPPYSEVDVWCEKSYKEATNGDCLIVLLCRADTSTRWFRKWHKRASKVVFLKRWQYIPPEGYKGKIGSPNMGSVLLIFGDPRVGH